MKEQNLYARFAASALRWPTETAIEVDDVRLSYRQFSHVVDRVAECLRVARGGIPSRVGLLAARNVVAYAGYLAAMRLGATVVPLNPAYPAARNALLCRRADVDAVILADAGEGSVSALPEETTVVDFSGDAGLALLDGPVPDVRGRTASGTDLAYILFTSGSTGVPKGVPIHHANVLPYLDFNIRRYQVAPGCRLSQTFDLTFDPSVFDLFVAWSSGATLVVPRKDELMSPVAFINDRRITHWYSVPWFISMADRLGQTTPDAMPSLRYSLFAGEQLTTAQAHAWRRAAPASVVENSYGPTELTVTCTTYRLPDDEGAWPVTANGTVPIGSPYPHMEVAVVDENGRDAPEGELCVRGPQRFGGYLDPADNAGRFLRWDGVRACTDDTIGPPTDEHWYRTGDRVRWQDGSLVHLGRLDNQVKISGCRVELGEIEALVRAQENIHEAAVFAVPARRGGVEIVAAFTGQGVRRPDLIRSVRAHLPRYMVPKRFEQLSEFPLNANGKIDRRRLAEELV